jgi:hypothetical protein
LELRFLALLFIYICIKLADDASVFNKQLFLAPNSYCWAASLQWIKAAHLSLGGECKWKHRIDLRRNPISRKSGKGNTIFCFRRYPVNYAYEERMGTWYGFSLSFRK